MNGIIYYTDNRLPEPLMSIVQSYILMAGLPIVSVSLKPINFGLNIAINEPRSYPTMVKQIIIALEGSTADNVFFCEHDVLYPISHFDFIPAKNNVFYYNSNIWRWWKGSQTAIKYDRMLPLSCMCANREFALTHYKMREQMIEQWGLDEFRSREPRRSRIWGYEPGTKKKNRGGLTDDNFETWESRYPVIDIRHNKTFSSPKIHLKDFKHKPSNWQEINIKNIEGWDLEGMFN